MPGHGRAWLVERQAVDGAHSCQACPPEVEFLLEQRAHQPVALPGGEIGVLHGQRRQCRLGAGGQGAIEFGELLDQNDFGPAVRDDMVCVEQQQVLALTQTHQRHAQRQLPRQIESASGIGVHQLALALGALVRRQGRQIEAGDRHWLLRTNDLQGYSVDFAKHGAQRLVALHQAVECALQRVEVERAVEDERRRHVVLGAAAAEAVDHPQPALLERHRDRCATVGRHQRRIARTARVGLLDQ
ncbi:hypothetical protein D3C72_1302060 [compost metagenome]